MNIFWLGSSPISSARFHNNKHLVKMIVELAQLMSTTVRIWSPKYAAHHGMYKSTHVNHPCAVWVRSHAMHYRQTYALWYELMREYEYRYKKEHSCLRFALPFHNTPMDTDISDGSHRLPPLMVGNITKTALGWDEGWRPAHMVDIVYGYRVYYVLEKRHLAQWKDRPIPEWYRILSGEFGLLGKIS